MIYTIQQGINLKVNAIGWREVEHAENSYSPGRYRLRHEDTPFCSYYCEQIIIINYFKP